MSVQASERLREYQVQVVEAGLIGGALQASEGRIRVLICSGGNIEDMYEEALEGEESVRAYAERQAAEAADLSARSVLRSLVDLALTGEAPSAADSDDRLEPDLNELYRAYASQWEDGIAMLDERIIPSTVHAAAAANDLPNSAWVERNEEGEVLVLDLPAEEAWMAPLIVPMGGFNECPQPVEQAVVFLDWQRRFGAVPTAVTQDSWLLWVGRKPESDEAALALAKEHFIFCQYVLESFETIRQYAQHLKRADVWDFWWD